MVSNTLRPAPFFCGKVLRKTLDTLLGFGPAKPRFGIKVTKKRERTPKN